MVIQGLTKVIYGNAELTKASIEYLKLFDELAITFDL